MAARTPLQRAAYFVERAVSRFNLSTLQAQEQRNRAAFERARDAFVVGLQKHWEEHPAGVAEALARRGLTARSTEVRRVAADFLHQRALAARSKEAGAIVSALAKHGLGSEGSREDALSAVEKLEKIGAKTPHSDVAKRALGALGEHGLGAMDPAVAARAAEALGRLGAIKPTLAYPAASALRKGLGHDEQEVYAASIRALKGMKKPASQRELGKHLEAINRQIKQVNKQLYPGIRPVELKPVQSELARLNKLRANVLREE